MVTGVMPARITYLQLLAIIIFLIPSVNLIKLRIENSYLRLVYTAYIFWSFLVIVRGLEFSKEFIFDTLIDGSGGIFLYLTPLILLFPNNLSHLRKVISAILILSVVYFLCIIIFLNPLIYDIDLGQLLIEYFTKFLGFTCGFVLFLIIYQKNKNQTWGFFGKLWAFMIIILTLLLAVIRARRGLIFMSVNILLITYVLYNLAAKNNLFYKVFPLFIVAFLSLFAVKIFESKNPGAFKLLTERINEDTRGEVEDYFYLDMTKKDWLVGRGMNGTFFCPTGVTEDGYRLGIETDYLTIILKGGIISLGLLFLITVPAVFLGLFYSKNILTKASACWILLWLINLFPSTVTTFSLSYLLVWICVAICFSKAIREMPEKELKEKFNFRIF